MAKVRSRCYPLLPAPAQPREPPHRPFDNNLTLLPRPHQHPAAPPRPVYDVYIGLRSPPDPSLPRPAAPCRRGPRRRRLPPSAISLTRSCSRAPPMLHANAAAIGRQERDVVRATDGLRRENDKLAKWSGDAARRVKELGNVQNWAEVLERDFLVLEETMRLVREGSSGSCGSWSGSGSQSGSWSGSDDGGDGGAKVDGDGDVRMAEDMESGGARLAPGSPGKGKGKGVGDVCANTPQNAAEHDPSSEAVQGRVQGRAATSLPITT
ncbi:conserved hypothetical protein [Verticillium alfalfae VaMs.102]|uniref:Biogenesis of lysosome-related organelles complex 1 subunit 1 n=1 Tax=Verticillium alfalfae (strain VaMs.102 / ATCC MYA-4576 / FGSC 10136) TaxID=526221 RepID=C9SLA1_VERA1|nr:conserved hypothetical protein [Verticillium alfalfae VaMs.102]EEY19469.1 conserved hypothetical protein [Verticillium alfalfae VaMs.102]